MQRRYYRIRETERGRFLPEWSLDGEKWSAVRYKSYARRGDATRFCNEDMRSFNGAWWTEGMLDLDDNEKAALEAWAETHTALIVAETQDVSPFDEEEQKRLEFAKWLRANGKLDDELHPADFGLRQPELLDA